MATETNSFKLSDGAESEVRGVIKEDEHLEDSQLSQPRSMSS
jgi:hypothetical protein